MPASRLQVDQRPQLYVTSRKQLQPNQQRITFSITGTVTCPSCIRISSNVSWHQQLHREILFTPEQSPSGTTLTKNLPKRLPSTASSVACTSPSSPFVDVISHIGSLIQMYLPSCNTLVITALPLQVHECRTIYSLTYHRTSVPLRLGWIMSNAAAVYQLRPSAQPRHNQRLGKSISCSYELERMHNFHRINPSLE